jgi:Haem degrading protein HbpS-like
VTSLERLIREEQELQFDRFDHDTAWALGVALVEAARAAGAPLAIDIRCNGHELFHAALHGTAPDNCNSASCPKGAASGRKRATRTNSKPIMASPTNPSATEKSVQNPWSGPLAPITAKTSGDNTAPR